MKAFLKKLFQNHLRPLLRNGTAQAESYHSLDRAALIFLIDAYSKYLLEMESHPAPSALEKFDAVTKQLISGQQDLEPVMTELKRYFSTHRMAENSHVIKSFEDFKNLIWSFVEQMTDDMQTEIQSSSEMQVHVGHLKKAIESDSLKELRDSSRQFIASYAKHQSERSDRRNKNVDRFIGQLDKLKNRLLEADRNSRTDHLTQAANRRSFDEHIRRLTSWAVLHQQPVSLIIMDLDHFKQVNDTHGHDIGDFILKEFSRIAHDVFKIKGDYFARIGGEEFAVILPSHTIEMATKRAEAILARVRREVFVASDKELRFTISCGVAQWGEAEPTDAWLRRADQALYEAKHAGRNRYTLAQPYTSQLRSA